MSVIGVSALPVPVLLSSFAEQPGATKALKDTVIVQLHLGSHFHEGHTDVFNDHRRQRLLEISQN